MSGIKVSVIIPYYNNENEIIRAIDSVVNQTYKDLEIIAVNDGSQDNSYNIVQDFIDNNSKYKIKNIDQKNQGPASARNKGVENAVGEYIAFLDADDVWVENKLEIQISLFEKYKDKYIIIGSKFQTKENQAEDKTRAIGINIGSDIENITFRKQLFKNYFSTPSVVIRRTDFYLIGGFPENRRYSEDYYFLLKALSIKDGLLITCPLFNMFKMPYGKKGLSSRLLLMEKGELKNYFILYNDNKIKLITLIAVCGFSAIKFLFRVIRSKF